METAAREPTGHVYADRAPGGLVWYAKFRLPDGRQIQRKLGPAWQDRGRPPGGYFTKRLAEIWLRRTLEDARRGTLAGLFRTGATTVAHASSGRRRRLPMPCRADVRRF